MGKGGRFGKYGEQKRFERLRQKKKAAKITRKPPEKKRPPKSQGRLQSPRIGPTLPSI